MGLIVNLEGFAIAVAEQSIRLGIVVKL